MAQQNLLRYSMLHEVLFPMQDLSQNDQDLDATSHEFALQRSMNFQPRLDSLLSDYPLVVFDFETTGLDASTSDIIEVGAIRWDKDSEVQEFSSLLRTDKSISSRITEITGIRADMLLGKPTFRDIMPQFLAFIEGAILIAHNATFDMSFLNHHCRRNGVDLSLTSICTLKMARALLVQLPKKSLDSLATHYNLTFEARHRSIGDAKVTKTVFERMIMENSMDLELYEDFLPYVVN